MTDKTRRLGRGLEALLGAAAPPMKTENTEPPAAQPSTVPGVAVQDLAIARISPNPYQPRRDFSPAELTDLENSLRASGLLQPISVREKGTGSYELIAGERRLRAATRLGWTTIPAIVRSLDDQTMLVLALVENLQRADLNPLDEALGYRRLMDEFHLTQHAVAEAVGKDRSTVANLLRVLALPEGIQRLVREGRMSVGHARALLALPNERTMLDAARRIVDEGLSVRDVERFATEQRTKPTAKGAKQMKLALPRTAAPLSPEAKRLTDLLRRRLQTDVRLDFTSGTTGAINVGFFSMDDLERVAELILGQPLGDA